MRHHASAPPPFDPSLAARFPPPAAAPQGTWPVIRTLLPYLLAYRLRIAVALSAMLLAKVANVGVPVVLKEIVDGLANPAGAVMALPVALIAGYGLMRLSSTLLTELREVVFARVTQGAVRDISLKVFEHLHNLSMRFHLERQTGGPDSGRGSV